MELRLQPKPEVEIQPANKGIVSRKEFFVKKVLESINQYFFPGHLIRNWKPKAELVYPSVSEETAIQYECDFNRDVQNCFVEDYAEEVFLRTPPPCFVVMGKLGTNVSKLGQEIAKEYGSVLIQVDDIVNQILKTETETAKFLERVLRLGVSLTLNFILALLSYMAHTAEARHRGYVLCGLPSLPHSYDLSVEQQINYLFSWENKPTVFINVLFEDEDLIRARSSLRYEIKSTAKENGFSSSDVIIKRDNDDDKEKGDEEEEEEEEDDEDKKLLQNEIVTSEVEINISPSRFLIQLSRDDKSNVWSELELFDVITKPLINLIKSRVDPQYFITVDSRVKNEFEVIKARLSLLQVWKVPVPFPFISLVQPKEEKENQKEEKEENRDENEVIEENEEDAEIRRAAGESPQTAFLILFTKKTISPKFRWELSHYNYICPVSLREGEVIEGKSKFAAVFMKYIYFLRDQESLVKFIQNPRPYVLPIRPKPLTRFIIVGYPFCGKTFLAESLAAEFSLPLIDLKEVLKNDAERKKYIYQEFCRQKAESREIIRLTTQSWLDWRTEEEQRVSLIENWIAYIQVLLGQRIEQFYPLKTTDSASDKETQVHSQFFSGENSTTSMHDREEMTGLEGEIYYEKASQGSLERGILIDPRVSDVSGRGNNQNYSTPSATIIQAMKHEDYNFNENNLEVEANLFFSTLWNTFSDKAGQHNTSKSSITSGETEENSSKWDEVEDISVTVDWCHLLPPQSLSSLLLQKLPRTNKEKRHSFQVLLSAASKAYWAPCPLKSEFAKWGLPCFMDITLCEIFIKNPLLLVRYCPDWLKERPLIPDPIDPKHPSIIEAGQRAFTQARVVTVNQNKEETGILLRNAIEKEERDGMRVTGEVISPGGWVVDNMVLDREVWLELAKGNVFADHVYYLIDKEPEHRRIINIWYDLYHESVFTSSEEINTKSTLHETLNKKTKTSKQARKSLGLEAQNKENSVSDEKNNYSRMFNVVEFLRDVAKIINLGNEELDEVYRIVKSDFRGDNVNVSPISVDVFTENFIRNGQNSYDQKDDSQTDLSAAAFHNNADSSHSFLSFKQLIEMNGNLPLGAELQIFTSSVINFLNTNPQAMDNLKLKSSDKEVKFFISLLSLPRRLEEIKDWLSSLNRGNTISEIVVTDKTTSDVVSEVMYDLNKYFIKKPRELESFEVQEIKEALELENAAQNKKTNGEEEFEGKDEGDDAKDHEDIRIYGESGPFCIVNLERDILLKGKMAYVLRYYGKLYFFWNEEAKQKFLADPEKYAPYYSPIRCLPPVRIFIMGSFGCAKSSLATTISNHIGLPKVNYCSLLCSKLVPYVDPKFKKFTTLTDQKLLLSEAHSEEAKELLERFKNSSYSQRQYWLERLPFFPGVKEEQNLVIGSLIKLYESPINTDFPELSFECLDDFERSKELEIYDSTTPKPDFVSMREIESIITDYICNNSGLTDYCVNKTLKVLWTEDPFITQGFIISNFPMRSSDIERLKANNWIPDLIIYLNVSEEEVLKSFVPSIMEDWNTKLNQEVIDERLLEDTLSCIQWTFKLLRRYQILTELKRAFADDMEEESSSESTSSETNAQTKILEKLQRFISTLPKIKDKETLSTFLNKPIDHLKLLSKSEILDSSLEHGVQFEAKLDEILKQEFPTLVFNPVFETYDSAKARIEKDMIENYRRDAAEIEKIKVLLQDVDAPLMEVDGSDKKNLNKICLALDPIKKRTGERGEFAFPVKMETAEKLLKQGFYFFSKFGKWCPVQVYRLKNPIHMFRPLTSRGKIIPIAYRNYIYFIGGENEKVKFINDPIKYTFNEPHHPNIPLRIAVIGPPKSGKSTLSKRLGLMFGLKVVTMGTALRFVVENMPDTLLKKSIEGYLRRGCFLPLSLKIEALVVCLNDPACVTQGFVFDGIPFDAALTQSLAEKGKLPFVILSLVGESNFGKTNREKLDVKAFRLPYKNKVNFDTKYTEWKETYNRFVQWNHNTYSNLYEMNAKSNVADIFYWAYDIIRKSFFGILYYVEYCVTDRVLPLQYLCVSQHEYELRKSMFHNCCPVCWVELNKLSCSTDPPPRSELFQYLNHFYWVCPSHIENFTKRPKVYFPPKAPSCPTMLPKVFNKTMFEAACPPLQIHGLGRCPVTRIDFPSSLDWEGSWNFAALYADEVYLCKNKETLDRFLARPWRYCLADTKFEQNRLAKSDAVKKLGPPKVTSLPPIGFLEQTVADLLHECLQVLGSVRPIYPNLSPACTGCIFIALYLKAHRKNKKALALDKQYLESMLNSCAVFNFRIGPFRGSKTDGKENLTTPPVYIDSDSSDESQSLKTQWEEPLDKTDSIFVDNNWLNLESQADKKMWSARYQDSKFTTMKLNECNELVEIPVIPKVHVVVKYQNFKLRPNPIPPVSNCITFIYTRKRNLKPPEQFNCNALHQPLQFYSSPFPQSVGFNPDKQFALELHKNDKSSFASYFNLRDGKRVLSETSLEDNLQKTNKVAAETQLLIERFIPRFKLLDVLHPVETPPLPTASDINPIIFNPHRDYTCTLLFSNFFHTSHVLRCFEWGTYRNQFEYSDIFSKNLGLCDVPSQLFKQPQLSPSMTSRKSIESYQQIFDAACSFYVVSPSVQLESEDDERSLINFIQELLFEKLEDIFYQQSSYNLSYDSFEIQVFNEKGTNAKPVVSLQEILPYPPLIWDITCRPYYSYCSVYSFYDVPVLDNIAHERHVSLLDGIKEPNEDLHFVSDPVVPKSAIKEYNVKQSKYGVKCKKLRKSDFKPRFYVYDFFNFPWTSFLTYPFFLACNGDFQKNFFGAENC